MKNDQELSRSLPRVKVLFQTRRIVAHHPWVEDPEKEMELLKEQEENGMSEISDMFPENNSNDIGEDNQDGDE